ncbi:hypothetical protein LWI28_007454 [Acer negundo]|uniref:Uncharacterized protein n=1 Tax=Acer negundo TaxID=4023 RepID=A0AAD5I5U6_ACENE|nr:hypothetical protein LWI28_007454 [Acer negundo]
MNPPNQVNEGLYVHIGVGPTGNSFQEEAIVDKIELEEAKKEVIRVEGSMAFLSKVVTEAKENTVQVQVNMERLKHGYDEEQLRHAFCNGGELAIQSCKLIETEIGKRDTNGGGIWIKTLIFSIEFIRAGKKKVRPGQGEFTLKACFLAVAEKALTENSRPRAFLNLKANSDHWLAFSKISSFRPVSEISAHCSHLRGSPLSIRIERFSSRTPLFLSDLLQKLAPLSAQPESNRCCYLIYFPRQIQLEAGRSLFGLEGSGWVD